MNGISRYFSLLISICFIISNAGAQTLDINFTRELSGNSSLPLMLRCLYYNPTTLSWDSKYKILESNKEVEWKLDIGYATEVIISPISTYREFYLYLYLEPKDELTISIDPYKGLGGFGRSAPKDFKTFSEKYTISGKSQILNRYWAYAKYREHGDDRLFGNDYYSSNIRMSKQEILNNFDSVYNSERSKVLDLIPDEGKVSDKAKHLINSSMKYNLAYYILISTGSHPNKKLDSVEIKTLFQKYNLNPQKDAFTSDMVSYSAVLIQRKLSLPLNASSNHTVREAAAKGNFYPSKPWKQNYEDWLKANQKGKSQPFDTMVSSLINKFGNVNLLQHDYAVNNYMLNMEAMDSIYYSKLAQLGFAKEILYYATLNRLFKAGFPATDIQINRFESFFKPYFRKQVKNAKKKLIAQREQYFGLPLLTESHFYFQPVSEEKQYREVLERLPPKKTIVMHLPHRYSGFATEQAMEMLKHIQEVYKKEDLNYLIFIGQSNNRDSLEDLRAYATTIDKYNLNSNTYALKASDINLIYNYYFNQNAITPYQILDENGFILSINEDDLMMVNEEELMIFETDEPDIYMTETEYDDIKKERSQVDQKSKRTFFDIMDMVLKNEIRSPAYGQEWLKQLEEPWQVQFHKGEYNVLIRPEIKEYYSQIWKIKEGTDILTTTDNQGVVKEYKVFYDPQTFILTLKGEKDTYRYQMHDINQDFMIKRWIRE